MFWTVLIIPQILAEFEYLNSAEFWSPSPDNSSQFWSRWFPDQRTEPKTQLLRLASVKNYKSYVKIILELHRRFFELSPMNKEHQRLGVSRYSLVYVYCFFAQLRKFLKLRLRFPRYLVDGVRSVDFRSEKIANGARMTTHVQLER